MALLTNHTYAKLCASIETDFAVSEADFVKSIYPDAQVYHIINSRERAYLFKYTSLLDDELKFKTEYYKEVPERVDQKRFVHEKGGQLTYHLYGDCKLLYKNFEDFIIPEEIKVAGDDAIDHYRNWFKENQFYHRYKKNEIQIDAIVMRFNQVFPEKYGFEPFPEDYDLIFELSNSLGKVVSSSFDLEQCVSRINLLKNQFQEEFNLSEMEKLSKFSSSYNLSREKLKDLILQKFGHKALNNKSIEWFAEKLKIAKTIKNQIILNILDYIKWSKNFDSKEFSRVTLEDFGLNCCSQCSSRETFDHFIQQ